MSKSNAKKCKDYRDRKKEGLKEVRGIYSTPELEIKIKAAAKEITEEHELELPEFFEGTKAALNKLGI